jgi:hypothetical protein
LLLIIYDLHLAPCARIHTANSKLQISNYKQKDNLKKVETFQLVFMIYDLYLAPGYTLQIPNYKSQITNKKTI